MRRLLPLGGFLCLTTLAYAIEAPAVADATLRSAMPASNFGALPQLQVDAATRSLIRFDLSALPEGTPPASLAKATLRLYVNRVTTPGVITINNADSPWQEAAVTHATAPSVGGWTTPFTVNEANSVQLIDVTAAGEFVADVSGAGRVWNLSAERRRRGVLRQQGEHGDQPDSGTVDRVERAARSAGHSGSARTERKHRRARSARIDRSHRSIELDGNGHARPGRLDD